MNSIPPLSDFFRNGKMDVGFEIQDGYIIGFCCMYPERTARKDEYMIRATSGVELDKQRGLNACVQDAKNLAYESAVNHYLCRNVTAFPAPSGQAVEQAAVSSAATPLTVVRQGEAATPAAPKAEAESQAPVQPVSLAGESSCGLAPESHAGAFVVSDDEKAEQIPLDGLVPPENPRSSDSDDSEDSDSDAGAAYKEALATVITICGKAHEKYGRTAGEILHSDPELIVYLAKRDYGGNKVEEYAAVKALYHDAVERVHKAA